MAQLGRVARVLVHGTQQRPAERMVRRTVADDLTARMEKWLDEQGYPLEMRATRVLRASGVTASPSWYFTDPETGQQRESDILAEAREPIDDFTSVQVLATVECKSSNAKPWILLRDHVSLGRKGRIAHRFTAPSHEWYQELLDDPELQSAPLLGGYEPYGFALVRAFAGGNEDVAYGAMLATAKAALGVCAWLDDVAPLSRSATSFRLYSTVLPVILIDAPLYECWLDKDGEVLLRPTKRGTVIWGYQMNLDVAPRTIVTILTMEALADFGSDMEATAKRLAECMHRHSAKDL